MSYPSINGRPVAAPRPVQLVSRTAILILSGVLIGTGVGHGVPAGLYICTFCAGVIGLISFVGLEHLAERQRQSKTRRVLKATERLLASRIDRHVPRLRAPRVRRHYRSRATPESSYLTVTTA